MPATALADDFVETERPPVRRFDLPDLTRHGGWMIERLKLAYPHLTDRELQGWLRGIIYSSEFLFLYQPNSVALAQTVHHNLAPKAIVQERFVFCEDKANSEHVDEAVLFYAEFKRWAKARGCDVVIVEELTDVPHKKLEAAMGHLFSRQQVFARVDNG